MADETKPITNTPSSASDDKAEQWSSKNPQATSMHLSADQAGSTSEGFLVLNGAPDGPATTIERDASGHDIRVRSAEDALKVLSERFHAVHLIEHRFPDVSGHGTHDVKVWVPE